MFDPIGWVVQPLLMALLAIVVATWSVALTLTWLPTFRSWSFRVGLFGPGRQHAAQLARYDRVCRSCAYPIGDEARCPECGRKVNDRTTIRAVELRTWAVRHPRAWLQYATIIAVLTSLSFFGGREALKLGNRMHWGAAYPMQTKLLMVHAPRMNWAYARTVELPIGPDYRVHYQSRFVTGVDFPFVRNDDRPQAGEVICWIGPPPALPDSSASSAQGIERTASILGVEPEQLPAMARAGSVLTHQGASAYPSGATAVRFELPTATWSTIGDEHPNKSGIGAESALKALYDHAGLLNAWHGSGPELVAMSERLDIHLRGGHLREITSGESPSEDFGVSCVNYRSMRTDIPLYRQPVGLVLFGLVQIVVVVLIIAYAKLRVAERRRILTDHSPSTTA